MNEPMRELETRVRRLERSNHLLMICCVALASVPLLLGAGGQGGQPKVQLPAGAKLPAGAQLAPLAPLPASAQKYISAEIQAMLKANREIHNVLRTRVLALVDKEGRTKAYLSTNEKGEPTLSMYWWRDRYRGQDPLLMTVGVVNGAPECVLFDFAEKPRLALYSFGKSSSGLPQLSFGAGGQLSMKLDNGKEIANLQADSNIFDLSFRHSDGQLAARIGSNGFPGATTREERKTEVLLLSQKSDFQAIMEAKPKTARVSAGSTGRGDRG
jgi:hypothetical protein